MVSPTILVLMLLAYLGYPLKLLFQSPGWWLIAVVGGAFWFGVGLLLQFGLRLISGRFNNSEGT